jgi:hypothetical protein
VRTEPFNGCGELCKPVLGPLVTAFDIFAGMLRDLYKVAGIS